QKKAPPAGTGGQEGSEDSSSWGNAPRVPLGEVACGDDAPLLPISRTVADAAVSATESGGGCFLGWLSIAPERDEKSDKVVQLLHAGDEGINFQYRSIIHETIAS